MRNFFHFYLFPDEKGTWSKCHGKCVYEAEYKLTHGKEFVQKVRWAYILFDFINILIAAFDRELAYKLILCNRQHWENVAYFVNINI